MSVEFAISSNGALERLAEEFAEMPAGIERAKQRALRKLMTWIRRAVLKEAAKAAGVTQKTMRATLRYRATRSGGGIHIWIGTNPLEAQYLGAVRWTRRMRGARAGRRLFPGSWSWGKGSATGSAIMRRESKDSYPIEPVKVEIHDAIDARLEQMEDEIGERFDRTLAHEINYALNLEGR